VDYADIMRRRGLVIWGGLLAGLGLGVVTAGIIGILGPGMPFPVGWELAEMAAGGLVLGLGAGLMLAAAIR